MIHFEDFIISDKKKNNKIKSRITNKFRKARSYINYTGSTDTRIKPKSRTRSFLFSNTP